MATDYDEPRKQDTEDDVESLELLKATATTVKAQSPIDIDEANALEDMELPGADLSGESLTVTVLPIQQDEFTCTQCFLVFKATLRSPENPSICNDCAA